MTNGNRWQENLYWSRDIVALLQIADSTLRKWCFVLESQGYRFLRDDQNRRAFTDHDAIVLRHFKELTQEKGVALETAAKVVAERFGRKATQIIAPSATPPIERHDSAIQRLLEHVERQEQFNQKLLQELADQRRYIEESLKRRDELLMQHLRESLETKKQLAATEQQPRKWWQFWSRKN